MYKWDDPQIQYHKVLELYVVLVLNSLVWLLWSQVDDLPGSLSWSNNGIYEGEHNIMNEWTHTWRGDCWDMVVEAVSAVTYPNPPQFDRFSSCWLGLGMGLGFLRFQNTGMR